MGIHEFAYGIRAATSSEVEWVHVTDHDFLLDEHDVLAMLPWLMPTGEYEGAARINIDRAKANGLTFRPLAETTFDVLEWWDSDAVSEEQRSRLLDDPRGMMQREAEIISAWKARQRG
jgi:2'-hydroxyisoflavone reductase